MLTAAGHTNGSSPTETLAAIPLWYSLVWSEAFRRAVSNRLHEEVRLSQFSPWLSEALAAVSNSARDESGTLIVSSHTPMQTPSSKHFTPPPSSLVLGPSSKSHPQVAHTSHRGVIAFAQIGGLVGDGTFASDRLTAAEAQYRGVEPIPAYNLALSTAAAVRNTSSSLHLSRGGMRSSSAALNSSYYTRPSTAALAERRHNSIGSDRRARSKSSTSHVAADEVSHTIASRRYLHLGGSKRMPISMPVVVASPSFTADPQDVVTKASSALFGRDEHSIQAAPPSDALVRSLPHVPIKRAQRSSGTRELLLQKAKLIANVIDNGQLYVSPVTGEVDARKRLALSPHYVASTSPQRKWETRVSQTYVGVQSHNTPSSSSALVVHGASVANRSSSHGQTSSPQGETSQRSAKGPPPLTDQEMVLRILAESASQVCSTMAQSTAEMLLVSLRRDIGDVRVSKRHYTVVPANSSNASSLPADTSDNSTNPTTSAGQPILIQSFTITSASSSDCLVALARKEIASIDESAAVLQDGAVEHGRKKLAREANSRKLGLLELTRAAEEDVESLPVLPNTCRMVALRALLSFGSEGVGEEHGFLEEMKALVATCINHATEIEQKNSSGVNIDSPLPTGASSPALSSALAWLWSVFRAVEVVLNKDHMPRSLLANITPGESERDRREGDAQRTNSVSSAVVESFLALAYDAVIGGVGDRREDLLNGTHNNSSSSSDNARDGFGIPTVGSKAELSSSSLILTAHATAPIPSQVRPFAEPSHGYADKRFVFMNPNRMLMALRLVLGPLLRESRNGSGLEQEEGMRACDKYTSPKTHSPLLESGTEYEHSPEASNNSTVAQHKRDNDLVLLLLVLLSKISFAEIVATAAAFMQPIWSAMTKPSSTTHHRPHLEYQSTPLSPTGTYEPPFVDLTVIEADRRTKGGPFPPSANRPSTAGANSSGSPSFRPTQQFSPPKRPESASSLSHLLRGGESSVSINTRGHRPAAVVAEEILARRQREEELSTPVPNRHAVLQSVSPAPILSMGVTKRDPITRISKDEYNLERVLMSRLSRRLVNAALEGSDMGAGGDNVPAAITLGGKPSTSSSSFKAQISPDQLGPSSLVKHLSDLHVRPLLPHAASPINNSLTASPNRLGLGGSTHNNALPPFIAEVEANAYRTVPSYSDTCMPPSLDERSHLGPTTKSDLPASDSSVSGSSPTKTDSHFVQYLQKGIIGEPYRKQLTKANPFVMTTLKRAAEVGARAGAGVDDLPHFSTPRSMSAFAHNFKSSTSAPNSHQSHFEQSEAIEKAVFGSREKETDRVKSPFPADAALKDRSEDARALKAVFDQDERSASLSGGEGGARSGSLTVRTPPKGYMNPTRLRSATRQQHFQRIQEHLLDPLDREEAANSGALGEVSRFGRPASATDASAAMTEATVIVRRDSHVQSNSNSRPTSGNFFSRMPVGFGRSFNSFSSKSPPSSSSPSHRNNSSFHLAREDAAGAGEDGNIVVREASDGSLKRVTVGSNLGETPYEVQIVGGGSRANTPNQTAAGQEEGAVALVGARDGGAGPKTQLVVLKGPPISAPSIPSPSRKRFGLPVREADRVIAAREAEIRGSPPNSTSSAVALTGPHLRSSSSSGATKLWTRSGSLNYSSSSPVSESKTKRAHPRVIHDVSAIPLNLADVSRLSITDRETTTKTPAEEASAVRGGKGGEGKPTKEASNSRQLQHRAGAVLGHRPVSADRDESGGTPNGAIVLVPQLAALPVTSGGSFSQRLSKGFLSSPTGRQKRF